MAGDAAIRVSKGCFAREAANSIMARAQNARLARETGPVAISSLVDQEYHVVVRCSSGSISESRRIQIRYANDPIKIMDPPFCITMPRAELRIRSADLAPDQ